MNYRDYQHLTFERLNAAWCSPSSV